MTWFGQSLLKRVRGGGGGFGSGGNCGLVNHRDAPALSPYNTQAAN